MKSRTRTFKFVDLFAGIGGFHQAMATYNGECVAASEINEVSIAVYRKNFPRTQIIGDITKEWKNIPRFDVLTGGFPCQPFSKAGKQQGFYDARGQLFYTIIEILKAHPECKIIILENVKNLADKINNWDVIRKELKELNFFITDEPLILSPTQFGIPQLRERVYILGIRKDIIDKAKLKNGSIKKEDLGFNHLPNPREGCQLGAANLILEKDYPKTCELSQKEILILNAWLEFKQITKFEKPGVPIWLDFFGYNLSDERFRSIRFHHIEKDINGKQKRTTALISEMPEWKQHFINKNRDFYLKHRTVIDAWIKKHNMLDNPLIYKKFEWNCSGYENIRDYRNTIIQFRQSGIRVKANNYFPTLVAINNTPVVFDEKNNILRKISPREAANLQSFKKSFIFPDNNTSIYKQLGNAINVKIVEEIFEKLCDIALSNWSDL